CHAQQKEWQPALEALRKALDLEPENRQLINAYGLALARVGRYDDAFQVLKQAGGEAHAHYNLGRMLHHLNLDEPSKEHLRLALLKKPDMEPARQMLAYLESPAAFDGGQPAQGSPVTGDAQPIQPATYQATGATNSGQE